MVAYAHGCIVGIPLPICNCFMPYYIIDLANTVDALGGRLKH